MGGDFSKGDNSPLDSIKNLAHKSFTAKMEKAFAPLQELIILKMEANESELIMPKNQFLELLTNAGFILNPDEDGDLDLTKQIQFIIDREIKFYTLYYDDGEVTEYDMGEWLTSHGGEINIGQVCKQDRKIVFRW